jgi:hypothetical protein
MGMVMGRGIWGEGGRENRKKDRIEERFLTKILYSFHISPIGVTYPTQNILLDLITLLSQTIKHKVTVSYYKKSYVFLSRFTKFRAQLKYHDCPSKRVPADPSYGKNEIFPGLVSHEITA